MRCPSNETFQSNGNSSDLFQDISQELLKIQQATSVRMVCVTYYYTLGVYANEFLFSFFAGRIFQ
jgi:hypothetical protein